MKNNEIEYKSFTEFQTEVAVICNRLGLEAMKNVFIGNERSIKKSINNDNSIIVTVLNDKEKEKIERVFEIAERRKIAKKDINIEISDTKKNKQFHKVLKNKISNKEKRTFKGKKIKRIIALIVAAGCSITIATAAKDAYKTYQGELYKVAQAVEGMEDSEVRETIYDILKEEISKATGADKEEIEFNIGKIGSSTERTKVIAGEKEYVYDRDLRSMFNFGNTLEYGEIVKIINEVNDGYTREELIKLLRKSGKFSKEKDLVEKNGKLKEVKAESQPETTRDDGDER